MTAEFHDVNVKDFPIELIKREDGTTIVQCVDPLDEFATRITDRLDYWAEQTPEKVFVAQRDEAGDWVELSYAETRKRVRSLASWMLTKNLSTERPIVILSGNSTEHLLMALAAMYIGVPYSPISPAYSLISSDYGKLHHIKAVLSPGMVFVDNLGPYRDAIDAIADPDWEVVAVHSEHALDDVKYAVTNFDQLMGNTDDAAVDAARDAVNGDTIAKFLFTSGSTGMPKAVINTQKMMCANQVMLRSIFAFFKDEGPTLIDWLPWNHTFGGNHNVGIVLYNGGSLYIDQGKPVPKGIETTLKNLADIAPSIYFNVPKGFELLVSRLEQEPEIAKKFFSRLQLLFFAGAGLSQHVWDKIDALAVQYTGKKVPMVTGLGATETAPSALFASIKECASGVVGTPAPGVTLKLVPNGDKLEVRVKAVTVMPGYWNNEEQTKKSFDEEGFYCLGDALKWIDENEPQRGFLFDGRVSEDFKLDTGTWVSVGPMRASVIHHFAPLVQDVVITGRDRGFIGGMIFPDMEQVRKLVHDAESMSDAEVLAHEHVREAFAERLQLAADHSTGSSTRVKRIILMDEPAKIDAHEITDKGSINQRAVMSNREGLMNLLYEEPVDAKVLSL